MNDGLLRCLRVSTSALSSCLLCNPHLSSPQLLTNEMFDHDVHLFAGYSIVYWSWHCNQFYSAEDVKFIWSWFHGLADSNQEEYGLIPRRIVDGEIPWRPRECQRATKMICKKVWNCLKIVQTSVTSRNVDKVVRETEVNRIIRLGFRCGIENESLFS